MSGMQGKSKKTLFIVSLILILALGIVGYDQLRYDLEDDLETGAALLNQNEYQKAIIHYEAVLAKGVKDHRVYDGLATAHHKTSDFTAAEEYWAKALELDRKSVV